jgi:hypothetical protein
MQIAASVGDSCLGPSTNRGSLRMSPCSLSHATHFFFGGIYIYKCEECPFLCRGTIVVDY